MPSVELDSITGQADWLAGLWAWLADLAGLAGWRLGGLVGQTARHYASLAGQMTRPLWYLLYLLTVLTILHLLIHFTGHAKCGTGLDYWPGWLNCLASFAGLVS